MSLRWHRHFLSLAAAHGSMSKDPTTKVGAIIVGPDREIRAAGFNGFPRGVADTSERLLHRETKLKLIVHAELNAILLAARVGVPLNGCTLYVATSPDSATQWDGLPCARCAAEIIQAGITTIVHWRGAVPDRWRDDNEFSVMLFHESFVATLAVDR